MGGAYSTVAPAHAHLAAVAPHNPGFQTVISPGSPGIWKPGLRGATAARLAWEEKTGAGWRLKAAVRCPSLLTTHTTLCR